MASDADELRGSDSDRETLERLAFSRPASSADAAASAEALRRLVEEDEAAAASVARVVPAGASASAPLPEADRQAPVGERPVDVADDPQADATTSPARRRTLLPIIVAIGLIIGLGVGFVAARTSPTLFAATPTPAPTQTAPKLVSGNAVAALAELASAQTASDKFPLTSLEITLDIDPKSVHKILTSDGLTLWIARAAQDICLIYTSPGSIVESTSNAGSTCATSEAFNSSGLTLDSGTETWTWNGITFSTTPDGAGN